jgi:hypothetical protein
MATEITITAVNYGNAPAALQAFSFWYKLFSALTWTLITNNVNVNTDGTLAVPQVVTGLTPGQLYYIRGAANCESPVEYFIQQVQT